MATTTPFVGRRQPVAAAPTFAEAAEAHLDDVYAYLVYLTGDRQLAEDLAGRDVRAGARPLVALRPPARQRQDVALPARADDRARPLPRRAQARRRRETTFRGARGARASASRSSRASRRRSSARSRALVRRPTARSIALRVAARARRGRRGPPARDQHHRLHDAPEPRARSGSRGGWRMSSLPDARYEELAEALRSTRPRAGADLRERVAALGRRPPSRSARARRRAAASRSSVGARRSCSPPIVVAVRRRRARAPERAAAATDARGAGGRRRAGGSGDVSGRGRGRATRVAAAASRRSQPPARAPCRATPSDRATTLPPSGRRLQEYRAELRVRVAARRALGGDGGGDADHPQPRRLRRAAPTTRRRATSDGDSSLVVRVPVGQGLRRRSCASRSSARSSASTSRSRTCRRTFNRQTDRIARPARHDRRARARAAAHRPRRRGAHPRCRPGCPNARAQLPLGAESPRARRCAAAGSRGRAHADDPRGRRARCRRRRRGDFEQTLRDAARRAGRGLTWLLAALIVASAVPDRSRPLGVALERRRRRRADERLLEQAT